MKPLDILFRIMVMIILVWTLFDVWRYFHPKKFCRDFATRVEMESYYYGDPVGAANLDRDGNKTPCEHYNYGKTP